MDEQLLKAIILFWDPSYRCFTFNQEDLTLIIEKYSALVKILPAHPDRVFWKKAKKVPFKKKLAQMMNIDAIVLISKTKQKGKNEYVQCDFLKQYIIENNDEDRVVDMFALVVYGTIIFPQSPEFVDAAIVDLIEQIDYPVILSPQLSLRLSDL